MYKTFKKSVFTFLLYIAGGGFAFAQSTFNTSLVQNTGGIEEAGINKSTGSVSTAVPPATILTRFNAIYPSAAGAVWYCTEQFNYVSFLNAGHRISVSFAPDGKPNYSIAECEMSQLPENFKKVIKREYKDARTLNTKRIEAYGKTAFWAVLENLNEFVVLKYTNDGVEELQHVKKVK